MKDLIKTIPQKFSSWEAKEKDEFYNRETLYNYIDGGAELYLTYDFRQIFVRKFSKLKNPDIILEIFDMGNSKDAFGIFSIERQDEEINIGQGSEYGGNQLRFWQDRYFVSIITIGDDKTTRPVMIEMAKKISTLIKKKGTSPEIISFLPEEGLLKTKIKYFHTFEILNRQYFLSNENILNLSGSSECVFAKYKKLNKSAGLLLIKYQNEKDVKKAYDDFLKFYLQNPQSPGYSKLENNKWTMSKIIKNNLVIVFDSPDIEYAKELISKIKIK